MHKSLEKWIVNYLLFKMFIAVNTLAQYLLNGLCEYKIHWFIKITFIFVLYAFTLAVLTRWKLETKSVMLWIHFTCTSPPNWPIQLTHLRYYLLAKLILFSKFFFHHRHSFFFSCSLNFFSKIFFKKQT